MRAPLLATAVLLGVLAAAGDVRSQAPAPAAPAPSASGIDAAVRALVATHALEGAVIGVAVMDVDSGKMLATHNEHVALNPASNAKLYTASAALAILHAEHRYETSLSGKVSEGAVGGVTLRGYGDPSLSGDDLAAMAADLRELGVHRVDGDILVDERFFDDQNTPPAYDQKPGEWAAFRAPVCALAVNEDTVTLTVRPGQPGDTAHAFFEPYGFVDVDGSVKTGEGAGADTIGLVLSPSGKRMSAKLSGTVGTDAHVVRFTRRVEDPSLLAGYVLRAALDRLGIKVTGDVKPGSGKGPIIVRHHSAPLSTLLYALGKNSDNFYAEMIFKSLAAEHKGRPAKAADAAEIVTKYTRDVGAFDDGVVIKNGSGLYDANRVTTTSVVKLLRATWRNQAIAPEYLSMLSIGGVDGTLHKRFRSDRARRAVRAKTGTLDEVISLSGYVLGPPGRGPIAFSIVFNKVAGKASVARAAADRVVEAILRQLWPGE